MGRTRYMSTAHDAMAKPRSFPDFHRKIVMPASATSKPMMNVGAFGIRGSIGGKIEGAVVVTVSVEVADADPGVTVGCESEHDDREYSRVTSNSRGREYATYPEGSAFYGHRC